jgi:acetyl-CoA carboxylase biotin carboxyl carrier protein
VSEIKPQDIETLLETFEASSWSEMKLKIDGLELYVSKRAGALSPLAFEAPPAAPTQEAIPRARAQPTREPAAADAIPPGWAAVRAPNLGTFYRAPKPGAPPYVKVGQRVEATTEVCLIEVMKLFTSVLAGVSGVVRRVLVEDSNLVEFDQPLFVIEPDP